MNIKFLEVCACHIFWESHIFLEDISFFLWKQLVILFSPKNTYSKNKRKRSHFQTYICTVFSVCSISRSIINVVSLSVHFKMWGNRQLKKPVRKLTLNCKNSVWWSVWSGVVVKMLFEDSYMVGCESLPKFHVLVCLHFPCQLLRLFENPLK